MRCKNFQHIRSSATVLTFKPTTQPSQSSFISTGIYNGDLLKRTCIPLYSYHLFLFSPNGLLSYTDFWDRQPQTKDTDVLRK